MKIIFAGTPDVALTPLQFLVNSPEHQIIAVYTQPDRPAGRGRKLTPSPVKQLALEHHIPVEQPENFKTSASINTLKNYQADLIIVMAYGLIVPKTVLESAKHGCINIHVSLLPRWRGAAPVQHAILAGDAATGITIMQMDEGLDTGDILTQTYCDITQIDTSVSLFEKLAKQIPGALELTLDQIAQNNLSPIKQDHQLKTYAHKFSKQDAEINWHENAEIIHRKIRAYNPLPVAYIKDKHHPNQNIRIWEATIILENFVKTPGTIIQSDKNGIVVQTSKNCLCITKLQLPGKKPLSAQEILNAHQDQFLAGQVI